MNSSPPANRPRLPSLKALVAFEAASRLGSFTEGARELAVTTSAVSHQIQQLEEFMGVQLFHRYPGRAELTAAGRTYAAELARAFALIADATALVSPQSQSGNLVIASGPSFAAKWLQPRLPEFLAAHSGLRVRLATLTSQVELAADRFDIAISYGRPTGVGNMEEPLLTERLRPLCSPELAQRLRLGGPADLERATLIHSSNVLTWPEYFRHVGVKEFRVHNEIWLDRSTMAIDAAVAGQGVALESEILASAEIADGRLIAPFEGLEFEVAMPSYFLVYGSGARNRPQARAFEIWLKGALVSAGSSISRANIR